MTLSAYDKICTEHLRLLENLAQLTKLFHTMPQSSEEKHSGTPLSRDSGRGAATPAVAAAVANIAQAAAQPHVVRKEEWLEREKAREAFLLFQEALAKHFAYEAEILFAAMLMAMPTKAMCGWVFRLVQEHGAVTQAIQNLCFLLETVGSPLPRYLYLELDRQFEQVRVTLMSHAADEDSKFSVLLKNNPEIAGHIRKLLQTRRKSDVPAPARGELLEEL